MRKLILEKLQERGLKMKEVSLRIGMSHSYMQQFLKRGIPAELGENERAALSQVLGVDEQLLRGPSAPLPPKNYEKNGAHRKNPVAGQRQVAYIGVPEPSILRESFQTGSAIDLPVFGTSVRGDHNGEFILSEVAVDWAVRPPMLSHVADAYAVIVPRNKMEPVVKVGSIVMFHPHLPPRLGDLCLFRSLREGAVYALGAEYRGETDLLWNCLHYTPNARFNLKKSEWQACHRAVGMYFP